MKSNALAGFALVMLMATACNKDHVMEPPPPAPVTDIQTVRLKEFIAQNLPSPLFHFTYTEPGFVSRINFADGSAIYDLSYRNQRIDKMFNNNLKQTFQYAYAGTNVSYISVHDLAGKKVKSVSLSYNNQAQLKTISWFVMPATNPQDSQVVRRLELQYDAQQNLSSLTQYGYNDTNFGWVQTTTYSDYDDKVNVDGFYLLKDFMSDLIFLPRVKLQLNNPGKVLITSAGNDYSIDYSYTYQGNLPATKSGRMIKTRGSDAGSVFNFTDRFTYY